MAWYLTTMALNPSRSAFLRAAGPVFDLALPVLVIGGLFYLGLSARHIDQPSVAASQSTSDPADTTATPPAPPQSSAAPAPVIPAPALTPAPAPTSQKLDGTPNWSAQVKPWPRMLGRYPYSEPVRDCPSLGCSIIGYVSPAGYMRVGVSADSGAWISVYSYGTYCSVAGAGPCSLKSDPPLNGWILRSNGTSVFNSGQ